MQYTELPHVNKGKCNPSGVESIKGFTMPTLRENAEWYIEFYAFDPAKGGMRRKKIKINRIKGIANRRIYAREIIKRLTGHLMNGWNPWIEASDNSELRSFAEVCEMFDDHIENMFAKGLYRKETYAGYKSYLKNIVIYNKSRTIPIYYIYQFDRRFCQGLLDWVFLVRNTGAQTRNNYLGFLKIFSGWCLERCYLSHRPTDGIQPISKKLYQKGRECLPSAVVKQIGEYLLTHNKGMLLASYLLYYCLIRPVEMTRLRIADINVKESTITVPADASKNHNTQTVTVPKKVMLYMIDLGIFSHGMQEFIFSINLLPGKQQIEPKKFRDEWAKVRRALKLKSTWKFYSLKDTGITEMLDRKTASISVRDQARHSSLAVTELYTQHNRKANPELIGYDGSL